MGKYKILIAENESPVASRVERSLVNMGYQVTSIVKTGKEALEKARLEQPDMLLIDIALPGEIDGMEAAGIILSVYEIPVIFLIADLDGAKLERVKQIQPYGYVLKPVQERALKISIEIALFTDKANTERKKAIAKVNSSEATLKSIFNAAQIGIGLVSNRVLLRVNKKFCEMLGYSEAELIGKNSKDFYPTNTEYDHVGEKKYDQIRKKGTGMVETRLQRKDGTIIDILLSSTPLNQSDLSVGVIFTALDITSEKKVNKALKESEEKYRSILENMVESYLEFDPNGVFLFSNNSASRIFGYEKKELIGSNIREFLEQESSVKLFHSFNRVHNTGNFENGIEFVIIKKDGTKVYAETSLNLLKATGHNKPGFCCILRDVTERKQAEKQIRAQKDFMANILDSLSHPFYVIDASTYKIKLANKASGYKLEQNEGITCHSLTHDTSTPCHGENHQCPVKRVKEEKTQVVVQHSHKDKEGNERLIEVSALPIFDEKGNVVEVIEYNIDVTEREKAQAELRMHRDNLQEQVEKRTLELSNKNRVLQDEIDEREIIEKELKFAKKQAESINEAKTQFLANISHELRTPMHHILNYSKFGIKKIGVVEQEKLLHYFSQIRLTGENLMSLLNDLLDLSKLESGSIDYQMEENDLNRIIVEMAEEFSSLMDEKEITLEIEETAIATKIVCDDSRLKQVIRNLFSNALKFTPSGKKIDIFFSRDTLTIGSETVFDMEPAAIIVKVKDEGIGIPDDELNSIFDKFVQSSKTRTGAGGTGLGLAICRQIIDAHHGRIWAENNPEGGASFCFLLPYEQN